MCVLSQAAFITIHQELSVTWPESRSISSENMARRNGNVKSVRRNMRCNQIGKLILRLVALKNTNVTAELSFLGNKTLLNIKFCFLYYLSLRLFYKLGRRQEWWWWKLYMCCVMWKWVTHHSIWYWYHLLGLWVVSFNFWIGQKW